jgi:hypothetical protein
MTPVGGIDVTGGERLAMIARGRSLVSVADGPNGARSGSGA